MENLMKQYRSVRVTDYFRDYAHAQINVAHRILEYLEPDTHFPPKDLHEHITKLFKDNNVTEAVNCIFDELDIDISSSRGYDDLHREAVEFATEVLNDYFAKQKQKMIDEREKLLDRLEELNEALGKNGMDRD